MGGDSVGSTTSRSCGNRKAERRGSHDHRSHDLGAPMRSFSKSPVRRAGTPGTPGQQTAIEKPQLLPSTTPPRARSEVTDSASGGASRLLLAVRGGNTDGIEHVVDPAPESAYTTLVTQFDSSPATYCVEDAGVRLHVRVGSMAKGQTAGPIVFQMDKRLLVECEGSWFFVSAVVDLRPSGSTFDVPLDLDFLVEEELDEQSDGEDASLGEFLDGCTEVIRNTHKVRLNVFFCFLIRSRMKSAVNGQNKTGSCSGIACLICVHSSDGWMAMNVCRWRCAGGETNHTKLSHSPLHTTSAFL